jgi:DNA repair protein RecO (recombination protein O)
LIRRLVEPALLVRSVAYGDADRIVTFLLKTSGKLATIVRGAQRSTKRFGGALEPLHELVVDVEDRGRELCVLKEARIQRARLGIPSDLEAMEAAGQALRWARQLWPERTAEPEAWRSLENVLDALDAHAADPRACLAAFGLRLLTDVGYALELERCVRCGRACPDGKTACIDAASGGIVCTSCGGARRTISGDLRALAVRAQRGEPVPLDRAQATLLIAIAEDAMAVHSGSGL